MHDVYRKTKSMDGMRPKPTSAIPAARPRPATAARPYSRPAAPAKKHKRSMPAWLQVSLAIPLIMCASLFIQSAVFGQIAIGLYGIAALFWQIPSRTTFMLALCAMVATTILLVFRGELVLAQNFATYTFLLLVVGVITLCRELRKEGGRIYSSRQNKHF